VVVFLDVCWRLVLAGLFVALFVLVNQWWVRVDIHVALNDGPVYEDPLYYQTGYAVARGGVESVPRPSKEKTALDQLLKTRDYLLPELPAPSADESWSVSVYGPLLLVGAVLALILPASRGRPWALLGISAVALALLFVQLVGGFPFADNLVRFNEACRTDGDLADPEGVYATPPRLVLRVLSPPLLSLALLAAACGVAALGFRLAGRGGA